jgi:hypothetical protein
MAKDLQNVIDTYSRQILARPEMQGSAGAPTRRQKEFLRHLKGLELLPDESKSTDMSSYEMS